MRDIAYVSCGADQRKPARYYKWLRGGGFATYRRWELPKKMPDGSWRPGEWMPPIKGDLVPCENGYHVCAVDHLLYWINAELYEAEIHGDVIENTDKVVARGARLLRRVETWNTRTARLFAIRCIHYTPLDGGWTVWDLLDKASRDAVDVAERFANGRATLDELEAADIAAGAVYATATDPRLKTAAMAAYYAAAGPIVQSVEFVVGACHRLAVDTVPYAARATRNAQATAFHTRLLLEMLGEADQG